MKARVNQTDDIANIEIQANQGNQGQEVNITEQDLTPWQKIYAEYKRNAEVLKTKYSPLLSEEILSKQSKDPYSLASIFKDMANENLVLASAANTNKSLKLKYYNDSAIACHHGLSILEKANCNNDLRLQELKNEIYRYLNDIQIGMVTICGGNLELLPGINNKADLSNVSKSEIIEQLRIKTKEQLTAIEAAKANKDDSAYIELTANVFKQVASGMEHYVAELYKEAEAILGLPPCDYTVIGLGSMALRQMTPYSDLEFAILTDNDNYKQSDDFRVREYFKNLSHLVHFKVINLGETIIPTSSYRFDFKNIIKTAVNFDLGGKTPLGRIEKDKPYELIQTLDGMLNYLKNSGKTTDHIDKNLASILQKFCFIYGSEELAKSYQKQAQKFLSDKSDNERPNYEVRAIKALLEGVEEIDYTKPTILQPKKIEGNLKQFSFKANKAQGKLFDVKQEIYRMPDRFIYNLGLIYGIQKESSWNTIDKLCDTGIINAEGTANLKKALSFATNLRLKTYSHYGCQKDSMDYAKTYEVQLNEVEKERAAIFKLNHEDLKKNGAFFNYYYTALALRKKLKEFCKLENLDERKEGFFDNNPFYQNDGYTKAEINLRLLRYEDALKYQLEELEITKKSLDDDHLDLATSLNNIGVTYGDLGDHNNALRYMIQALEIWKKSLGDNHLDVATSLNNIGITYGALGQHKKALKHYEEALEIRKKSPGDNHLEVATSLNNIGYTYGALDQPEEALKHYEEALEIREKSLDANHLSIAISFNNIGEIYGALGKHKEALEYHAKSLEIRQKSLGDDHPDVATSLNNIGCTYDALGNYTKALKYKTQALEIWKKLLGKDHLDIATSLNNIGYTYGKLGDHKEAIKHKIQALEIKQKFLNDNHLSIAASLNNVGYTYGELGDHHKALEYQTKALKIFKESLGSDHSDTIICRDNVLQEYYHLGMYQEASAELLAGILAIYEKTNQQEKISFYSNIIAHVERIKGLYEDSNKLLDSTTIIVQSKEPQETSGVLGNLNKALSQLNECNNFKKSDIISKNILRALDLLIKVQTTLYNNSKKNDIAILEEQLNLYKKEYKDLKKSMDDKQLKLQEIEEYLAAQKQAQGKQSDMQLADDDAFSIIENSSSAKDMPEKDDLVSLTGTLTEENS